MTTRQTSIDCYNQINAEGLLSKLRLKTLNALLYSAPCTAGELQNYIDKNQIQVKHSWKLLSQLRDLGVLYEKNERKCNITGRVVIEWDLTDNLPIKIKKISNSKKDRIAKAINALRNLYKNSNSFSETNQEWIEMASLIRNI